MPYPEQPNPLHRVEANADLLHEFDKNLKKLIRDAAMTGDDGEYSVSLVLNDEEKTRTVRSVVDITDPEENVDYEMSSNILITDDAGTIRRSEQLHFHKMPKDPERPEDEVDYFSRLSVGPKGKLIYDRNLEIGHYQIYVPNEEELVKAILEGPVILDNGLVLSPEAALQHREHQRRKMNGEFIVTTKRLEILKGIVAVVPWPAIDYPQAD